jgi:hypothetical protein
MSSQYATPKRAVRPGAITAVVVFLMLSRQDSKPGQAQNRPRHRSHRDRQR